MRYTLEDTINKFRDELKDTIYDTLNDRLIQMVISGKKDKTYETLKVKIRPVIIKDELLFQATSQVGAKVIHSNYDVKEALEFVTGELENHFNQCQITMEDRVVSILVSKKGKVSIKSKHQEQLDVKRELTHNREKNYLIPSGKPVGFLVDLQVMTPEGKIINSKYDKYRQINRFLEFVEDITEELEDGATIIDFGCGKSYLTFAMYYYLREIKNIDVNIIGLDLKKDVIENCNKLRDRYGYDKLDFRIGDIADFTDVNKVDMVVTLHACNTATDYALAKAVNWGARVILSVPCCQHEVNAGIHNELLEPVLKYGILKERISALVTDGIRAEVLTAQGYDTQILEFIDMEHTPKNILIRAVKRNHTSKDTDTLAKAERLLQELNVSQTFDELMKGDRN